jgi:hypothetical protein
LLNADAAFRSESLSPAEQAVVCRFHEDALAAVVAGAPAFPAPQFARAVDALLRPTVADGRRPRDNSGDRGGKIAVAEIVREGGMRQR